MGSPLVTGIIAVLVGGALAVVAAVGVVQVQASAGTSVDKNAVATYDGS